MMPTRTIVEQLTQIEGTLLETLAWLRSLHPMPSRSQRIRVLDETLATVRAMQADVLAGLK
jgi:hypothetical protein